jgi:hypothetical protein
MAIEQAISRLNENQDWTSAIAGKYAICSAATWHKRNRSPSDGCIRVFTQALHGVNFMLNHRMPTTAFPCSLVVSFSWKMNRSHSDSPPTDHLVMSKNKIHQGIPIGLVLVDRYRRYLAFLVNSTAEGLNGWVGFRSQDV